MNEGLGDYFTVRSWGVSLRTLPLLKDRLEETHSINVVLRISTLPRNA